MELSSNPTAGPTTPEKDAFRKIFKMIEIFKPMVTGLGNKDVNKLTLLALLPKIIKKVKDCPECQEVFSEEFLTKIEEFAR